MSPRGLCTPSAAPCTSPRRPCTSSEVPCTSPRRPCARGLRAVYRIDDKR